MSIEVEFTCDLCGKVDHLDYQGSKPYKWSYITVAWDGAIRRGLACDNCTTTSTPIQGMKKYWQQALDFLGVKR